MLDRLEKDPTCKAPAASTSSSGLLSPSFNAPRISLGDDPRLELGSPLGCADEDASRCWRKSPVCDCDAPSTWLRPYWIFSPSWSPARTKLGRRGMTSGNPAARCQLLAKDRKLLTPPMSAIAARWLVTEDLDKFSCHDLLFKVVLAVIPSSRHESSVMIMLACIVIVIVDSLFPRKDARRHTACRRGSTIVFVPTGWVPRWSHWVCMCIVSSCFPRVFSSVSSISFAQVLARIFLHTLVLVCQVCRSLAQTKRRGGKR